MNLNKQNSPAKRKAKPEHFCAKELFKGNKEVLIDFAGEVYRLRITRNDKLILTK